MRSVENSPIIPLSDDRLPPSAWQATLAEQAHTISQLQQTIQAQNEALQQAAEQQRRHENYIQLLEEYLRLAKLRQYAAKSEKIPGQGDLFDEAELEVALQEQAAQLPDDEPHKPKPKKRQRQFSSALPRVRVDHCLTEAEKQGALKTFFTKVKEELDYIPARLQVIEHWQEKAVFEHDGNERVIAAARPVHPLGKCVASVDLLAYVLVSKYADGLPLYRLEKLFKRSGQAVDRSDMAHWIVRLDHVLKPLITLMRESQNSYDVLQADESVPRRRTGGGMPPVQLCCTRDEGRSLGVAVQAEASNHLLLLRLRGVVVSEIGKGQSRIGQVGFAKSNASEPLMTCRNLETMSKLRGFRYRRISPGGAC